MGDVRGGSVRLITPTHESAMDEAAAAARVLLVGTDGTPYSAGGGGLTDAELRASAVPVVVDAAALAALETTELGAATLAALETVSVANFPATQPVSAVSLPLPTGAATEATLAAIQTLVDSLATLAETQPVSLASVPAHAVTGPLTDAQLRAVAVPVSIAAALALDAGTLAALETISAVQSGAWVTNPTRPATSSVTSVADSASSVSLLASTAGRLAAMIFNDSTEILYVKFGATASTTSYTAKLQPDGYLEFPQPCYTGAVDGIWANNASGSARITELTA